DKGNGGAGERNRECLALGQEAIARMHRLGPGRPAGFDDLVDLKVALCGGGGGDGGGVLPHLHVHSGPGGVGIDRDGRNLHAASGLDDAARDLAAVGDQNALEHPHSRSTRPLYACVDLGPMSTPEPSRANKVPEIIHPRAPAKREDRNTLPRSGDVVFSGVESVRRLASLCVCDYMAATDAAICAMMSGRSPT